MPRIPPETIDQILAATDIVDVIGGYFPLKRAGATYKALCPFHQEKSPSFTVNPQRQMFKCFGCGAGGSALQFVMEYEHLNFISAAKKLAERAGIRIVEEELSPEDNAKITMRRRLLSLHAEAADWFHHHLLKSRAAQPARDYLKGRGINIEIARAWKIGYAPNAWHDFSGWASERGYSVEEIKDSGLVSVSEGEESSHQDPEDHTPSFYDRFRHRVMFPICNDTGEVIAFSGRVLQADVKAAKYVNSPETILFTKGSVLFGLHRSKRPIIDKKSAIVCEGQLDLITAFEAGIQNVIAPQGTAFTEKQAHIIKRYAQEEVVLCFDSDGAGEKAAERSLKALLSDDLSVRVVSMPPGEDPDSLIRTQGAAVFLERVTSAKDFFDFQLDRMMARPEFATPRGRVQAAAKFGEWIGWVKNPMLRDALIIKVAARLEVSTHELLKLIKVGGSQPSEKADAPVAIPKLTIDRALREMAHAILHSPEARAWVSAAPWRELLAREPDSALLGKIIEAELPPENPTALNVFLATLDQEESKLASDLLETKPPPYALAVVQDTWNEIARRQLQRRIDSLHARMKMLDPNSDDAIQLLREIMETQKRLQMIPRMSSPQF